MLSNIFASLDRLLPVGRFALGRFVLGQVALAVPLTALAALSAEAIEINVSPTSPQLGDTINLLIHSEADTAPVVSTGDRTYPSFPVGPDRYRALIPTTPLETPGARTFSVTDELGDQASLNVNVGDRDFPIQDIWLSPEINAIEGTDYEFDRVEAFRAEVTPDRLWTGSFLAPSNGSISTPYGVRRYYNGEWADDYYHRGLDYAAATGSPVYAAADGIVGLVDYEANGFEIHGNTIGLNHGQGVTTMYLHLSEIYVREGDRVRAGETIGAVGATGISTGPHLHWGFFVHGEAVDPRDWQSQGIK
ncbi:MAG: M23 family metallopeptidase [Oscillatoriales cyanobacterium]|nr:MAG: M23 family metallopeptidase [Oscillatoriales cyanobacterium]